MTLADDWTNADTTAVFKAVLTLETVEEAEWFFRDLCTAHELEEITKRWAVVRKLADRVPYRQIADETGSSSATITRINQWLRSGAGGYRLALDRLGLGKGADR